MKQQNTVYLQGNLGKDPSIEKFEEFRYGELSVATHRTYKDKEGKYLQKTEWHLVKVYDDKLIDEILPILKKGDGVSLLGELRTRAWKDKNGLTHKTTEVCVGYGGDLIKIHKEAVG